MIQDAQARDEASALSLELDSLSSLRPEAHPLAIYGAVERVHNRRRGEKDRTQFSARTVEARLSARGFPESDAVATPEFAQRAAATVPLLETELQRVFEAFELLENG